MKCIAEREVQCNCIDDKAILMGVFVDDNLMLHAFRAHVRHLFCGLARGL